MSVDIGKRIQEDIEAIRKRSRRAGPTLREVIALREVTGKRSEYTKKYIKDVPSFSVLSLLLEEVAIQSKAKEDNTSDNVWEDGWLL